MIKGDFNAAVKSNSHQRPMSLNPSNPTQSTLILKMCGTQLSTTIVTWTLEVRAQQATSISNAVFQVYVGVLKHYLPPNHSSLRWDNGMG